MAGTPTAPGNFEAVVALVAIGPSQRRLLRCTATLITPTALLTAAHCLTGLLAGEAPVAVVLGPDARDANAQVLNIAPANLIVHPRWTPPEQVPDELVQFYDLALLRLEQPLTEITPLGLINPLAAEEIIQPGYQATAVGVGRTDPADAATSGKRLQGPAHISEAGPFEFRLAAHDAADTAQKCEGDSGGPTLAHRGSGPSSRWEVIGIGSRARHGCLGGSVDTRVDAYLEWLHETVEVPCGSGLSAPCPDTDPDPTTGCAVPAGHRPWQQQPPPTSLLLFALVLCSRLWRQVRRPE